MSQTATVSKPPLLRRQLPPGPRGHPLFGHLLDYRRNKLKLYQNVARQYGDVNRIRFLWVNTFVLNHPDYFKHVLQDNNHNYVRNTFFNAIAKLTIGNGLFTIDGEEWLSRRRLMQPAFHRQRIASFGSLMSESTLAMLDAWDAGPDGQRLDIDREMMRLTLRVAGKALFSVDLLAGASALGEAFTHTSEFANYRLGRPFPPPLFLPTRQNREFKSALNVLNQTIYKLIRERRAFATAAASGGGELLESTRPNGSGDDLLSMLLAARDADTGEGMSDEQIRNEVATLMFAGHETTAVTLTWAFYLLSQHPEAERKLHAELAEVLGNRAPTLADLPNLKYTRMVIDETLRMYPPAFGITRQSLGADEFGGYSIPPNSSVTLLTYNVHYDARWWNNPEQFDPERFSPQRSEGRPNFAYLPFGGGPRQCIGNMFALTEAQLVLATVAQHYQLRLVPGHPVEPNPIFVLRTSHGLPMTAHRRCLK